jgi:hypothetical protein
LAPSVIAKMVAYHEAMFPNPGGLMNPDLIRESLGGFDSKRWDFRGVGPFVDGDLEDRAFYEV